MITPISATSSAGAMQRGARAALGASEGRGGGDPDAPVLIVGGGIAGCTLAYSLARRGVPATLLEGGRLGSRGASAVAAALLNPHRGRSGKPGPLDRAGLTAFWQLASDLEAEGRDPGAHRSGVIRIPSSERQARAWEAIPGMARLAEVPAPYRAPHGAFLVDEGGWVEPARLIAALAQSARSRGAVILEGRQVEHVERRGDSWWVNGQGRLSARSLVLCLGAGEIAGVELPSLERVAGDQITLRSGADLRYPIAGPVYLAGNGRQVFVGGNHRAPETEDPRAPTLLKASAARMVPPLAEAEVERVWTGVRAKRDDNVPLLEELQPDLWYLGAFGGRGFLTAPLLAERLAARITEAGR